MLGGIGGRRRGWPRMRWLDGITHLAGVWASSRSWWWTGKPGVLQSMGLQRVGHDWETERRDKDLNIWLKELINISIGCMWDGTKNKFILFCLQFSPVQSLSPVRLFATPWIAAHQAYLSITNSRTSLKLMSIELVMPSSHLILCHPLLLPPIPPSIRVFSNESTLCMRWPNYWSLSFSISPSKEHPGLLSFRMDWLDLLAVQGTLKSLLQHHSSKASILQCWAFFTVQLSHPETVKWTSIWKS